jgi:hypothetical protein
MLVAAVALAVTVTTAAASEGETGKIKDLSLELVGQVTNSPVGVRPATSIQYGYLAYLRGMSVFSGDPQNETTARFTFYTSTTTVRVIANGPLRIISREGTVTIYDDPSANGSFVNPDSFRDGTPIMTAGLRQQVIVDTLTGAFTALNRNTIISTTPFTGGDGQLELGKPGGTFKTVINGHLNTTGGAPSAYMAGYTVSAGDPARREGRTR